jgi:hypothetical protein
MKNLIKYYPEGVLWQYMSSNDHHCHCGSNVYHHEYDGENIWGVCNACGEKLYQLKDEYAERDLEEGEWK